MSKVEWYDQTKTTTGKPGSWAANVFMRHLYFKDGTQNKPCVPRNTLPGSEN